MFRLPVLAIKLYIYFNRNSFSDPVNCHWSKMVFEKKSTFSIIREINHPFFRLTLRDDGIVQMTTEDNAYFTLKEAKEYVAELEKMCP